jgi:hypothetical protein
MGLWSKLFGEKTGKAARAAGPPLELPTPACPTTVNAIPGELTVTFHVHDNAEESSGRFLSAVTHGLSQRKQREIVITLRLGPQDDLRDAMLQLTAFFKTVHVWARDKQLVHAGNFTQFGQRALFGRPRSGLLYADARPLEGVELPPRALAGVLVDAAEVSLARDHGTYRVLTRIGQQQRHFPFPTWSELARPSVATAREGESLLAKVRRTHARSVSFVVERRCLRILLAPSVVEDLGRGLATLPPGAPFALLTKPAASANAVLVWHPGQSDRTGISPDGSDLSRMSGSCLLIVPGGQEDETRCVEDGYSLLFSTESWSKLVSALAGREPLKLKLSQWSTLEVEWLPEETN